MSCKFLRVHHRGQHEQRRKKLLNKVSNLQSDSLGDILLVLRSPQAPFPTAALSIPSPFFFLCLPFHALLLWFSGTCVSKKQPALKSYTKLHLQGNLNHGTYLMLIFGHSSNNRLQCLI